MTEATAVKAEEINVPDTVEELVTPTFTPISPNAARTCDRHPTTYALVEIVIRGWKAPLEMCGNCARKHFGYEHTKTIKQENRQKGSEH